ncbi:MAG: M3 family metallopeptidase, partial [Planctomycetota bacterium]|nr:M3 family metallopeptidase [Planctomycetota bacterium]
SPDSDGTVFDVQRRISERTLPMMPLPEDRFLCAFTHIFAGGYSAGYYSYLWAEVLSADAFGAFEEAGLDNDQAVRELGRKFRDTVLALGGSAAPAEVFESFRGRAVQVEALLRHRGIA